MDSGGENRWFEVPGVVCAIAIACVLAHSGEGDGCFGGIGKSRKEWSKNCK